MTDEILTPVGRLVQGHPMDLRPVNDKKGVQKLNKNGDKQFQCFVAVAIVKGPEQHWNQTEWGAKIWAAGQAGWPGGEWQAPTFAWKIIDGDSRDPNKKGRLPCDYEGFPGHWVIGASNGFAPDCFGPGHNNYTVQCMRKETFKTGDYVRLVISMKGNDSSDSPGVYVNMQGCELIQAGIAIQSSSFDAQGTFGSAAAVLPAGAQVDPNMPATTAPGVTQQTAVVAQSAPAPTPVPDALPAPVGTGPDLVTINGQQYDVAALKASGKWSDEQIHALR